MLALELGHFPNLVRYVAGQICWHKEGVAQRWELAPREWDEVGIISFPPSALPFGGSREV